MAEFTIYDYWRSSAAYRIRIALNVKGLPYTSIPVNLKTAENNSTTYRAKNPQGRVPILVEGEFSLPQSLAIMEYLEETHPTPPLLPKDAKSRAIARAFALTIAADIHPMNNLSALRYLTEQFGADDAAKTRWMHHWLNEGFTALETLAKQHGNGKFSVGNAVSMADCCLIPQLYNARRFECPLDAYPTLTAIEAHCNTLPAFEKSKPANQPDAKT